MTKKSGVRTGRGFPATRWSVVIAIAEDDGGSRAALEELCRTYWPAIYAYIRHRGYGREDAEDLTQGFLAKLVEKRYVAQADATRGRFRTFLRASLDHYVANEWHRSRARKRGGDFKMTPLEIETAEGVVRRDPGHNRNPEKLFVRQWAYAMLNTVLERLCREMEESGNGPLFHQLKGCLTAAEDRIPYQEVASRLGKTEGAVKVAAFRMKERYKALLLDLVADTVTSEADVDDEIRVLLRILSPAED